VGALHGRRRLLVIPDGGLAQLPFETLPTDDGRHLIEDYCFGYLNVARDVLRYEAEAAGPATDALVVAGPDPDLAEEPAAAGAWGGDGYRRFGRIEPRPASQAEAGRAASVLGVRPWLGGAALKGRLQARRSPHVLHLAAPVFSVPEPQRGMTGPAAGGRGPDGP